jgi:hypothetical protein
MSDPGATCNHVIAVEASRKGNAGMEEPDRGESKGE